MDIISKLQNGMFAQNCMWAYDFSITVIRNETATRKALF